MPGVGTGLSGQDGPDVLAVEFPVPWWAGPGQVSQRGQYVDGAGDGLAAGAGGNPARPTHHARPAHATLVSAALAAAQGQVAALLGPGGSVVGGEQHQGLLVDIAVVQRLEQFAHRPVNFLDPVAVESIARLATKSLGRHQGKVHGGVWQVQEEGPGLVGVDELHRLLGVLPGDGRVFLDAGGENFQIPDKWQRHVLAVHVVAVGDAKVMIEALISGHEIGVIAQMPFADAHGGVALLL